MKEPDRTQQLKVYGLKLLVAALFLILIGMGLLAVSATLGSVGVNQLWTSVLQSLADAFIVTGAIGLGVDYFTGRDKDAADTERTRTVLKELTPDFTDAVVRGFAAAPTDLERVASPQLLDGLATNAMALRLGDAQFAAEIYTDVRDQAIRAAERWHDVEVTIRLSTAVERGTQAGAPLFDVLVEWAYTTKPSHDVRRFTCVSNRDEFDELATEVPATSTWFMTPRLGVDPCDRQSFELLSFSVDGHERRIRRQVRRGGQTYSVRLDAAEQGAEPRPVRVKHVHRVVTAKSGHVLFIEVPQPVHNLSLKLDYTNTDVARMSIMDLVSSSQRTRVDRLPEQAGVRVLSVDLPGWLLPRAGFSFVWTLVSEDDATLAEPTTAA